MKCENRKSTLLPGGHSRRNTPQTGKTSVSDERCYGSQKSLERVRSHR